MKLKACVIVFPGSTCDYDTHHVMSLLGVETDLVWHDNHNLQKYNIIFLPGGFTYGDYLRAGAIARFSPSLKVLGELLERDRGFVVGICNGFQILTESHFLSGALARNHGLKFLCKKVKVRIENNETPFTHLFETGEELDLWIAHSEGRYLVDYESLEDMKRKKQIFLRYSGENPNGSIDNIAGIMNENMNVFGLMPHPERVAEKILGDERGVLFFKSLIEWLKK